MPVACKFVILFVDLILDFNFAKIEHLFVLFNHSFCYLSFTCNLDLAHWSFHVKGFLVLLGFLFTFKLSFNL